MPDLDLIVVGGGPAGISTALHLQALHPALAERTLVLERERYPREKFCAGGLGGRAVKRLERLGVPLGVPHVPLAGAILQFADQEVTLDEPGFGVVVRRIEFDAHLARTAMARGLRVREGAKVEAVEELADGVRVRLAGGEELTARAVVGCDGVSGVVRRSAGFGGGTWRAQVVELDTEEVADDPPRDHVRFDVRDPTLGGYAWDFPTLVDGQAKMCRGVYLIRQLGADNVHERLRQWLAARGLDMRRYKLKPFGERGFDPEETLSRNRVLLAGEAAGIDIATGEGIAQAIEYGELAARYLSAAFRRGALDFADWTRVVHHSPLGVGLQARLFAYRLFYLHRERAQRLFRQNPAVLNLYAHHFAGNPLSLATLAGIVRRSDPRELPWALSVLRARSPRGQPRTPDAH